MDVIISVGYRVKTLIDNYIDETVLTLFAKRKAHVKAIIYTQSVSDQLKLDVRRFNAQYPKIDIKIFQK